MRPLEGKIAVVAGATRGVGRGIACMLGEAGATVYCTGRSVRGHLASGPNRPETIEETAEMVTGHGGVGIPVRVDHTVPDDVRAFCDRVRREQGVLDILVNDVWGGDELTEWGKPLWEHSLDKGLLMQQRAVHSHFITSHFALPLLLHRSADRGRGLVVEVTDGISHDYRGTFFYDLAKASVIRMAHALAYELRPHRITALAVTPGFLRSEAMLDRFGVTEDTWQEGAKQDPHFAQSETPYFVGRAVAALAADPTSWRKSGTAVTSWDLSDEYGFTDIDGRRPHWGRYMDAQVKARWPQFVERVRDTFRARGVDPSPVLEHDPESLTLRARLTSEGEPEDWYARKILAPELFMLDAGSLSAEFFDQYRGALHARAAGDVTALAAGAGADVRGLG
jgi:NAD(P)-dependent dehydrogenase (short-subunit alcohol dehydrogenase family)